MYFVCVCALFGVVLCPIFHDPPVQKNMCVFNQDGMEKNSIPVVLTFCNPLVWASYSDQNVQIVTPKGSLGLENPSKMPKEFLEICPDWWFKVSITAIGG